MTTYRHHVSGFFAHRAEAEEAFSRLVEQGLPRQQLQIVEAVLAPSAPAPLAESNDVLKDVVVDGVVGTAVGTGIGALAEVALVVANVSLFVASPLIAPLVLLGWGASLGGLIGAAAGASSSSTKQKTGALADLVGDAIASGQVVLVVEARNKKETEIAQDVLRSLVGHDKDVNAA